MTQQEMFWNGVLADLVGAVRAVPGVHEAAGAVRRSVRAAPPSPRAPAAPPVPQPSRAPEATPGAPGTARAPGTPGVVAPAGRPLAELDGGPLDLPAGAPLTLQEALRLAAELAPDKGTVYVTRHRPDDLQTYPELLAEAQRVLGGLRALGLRPGDAALFVFDDHRCFLTAYWACVLGGFVPTPVARAATYATPHEANRKLHNAWELLDRPVLLTDAATRDALAGVRRLWDEPGVRIATVEDLLQHGPDTDWFPATPDSPVLNLLTSGSTGVPKCVHHRNGSVASRVHSAVRYSGLTADDVTLTWMPFDHVTVPMHNVRDVFLRCLHVNVKTDHVLGDVLLWLDLVDRYRVTNTWAPNFAVALVNDCADEIARRSWDLSCLREIVNGGEPVVARTSHRFLELLAPHGLPADAMTPVWGMSETCSGVTSTRQSRDDPSLGTVAVDPATLGRDVRHVPRDDPSALVLSTVGRALPGVRLRVVDDAGRVLPEDRIGELVVRGRTMLHCYFNNPQAQRDAWDEQGWFHTGDLAFVHDGELVIAGRIKDQIIVRGNNFLAHELESVVERADGVRPTFSAAAAVRRPGDETDRLAVFFVPRTWDPAALAATAGRVRAVLAREAGLAPDLLVPLTEAEFAKTASGKIQRSALVEAWRSGAFDERVLTAGPDDDRGDGAGGTWLAGRRWAELGPAADPDALTGPRPGRGTVLVLAADGDLAPLGVEGAVTAVPGDGLDEESPTRYRVAASDPDRLRDLFEAVADRHGPVTTVLFALPLARADGAGPVDRSAATTAALAALASVLDGGRVGSPRILVLTCGAVHARPGDRVDLGACALPGLVRTLAAELPACAPRLLDLPADRDAWARAVRAEVAGPAAPDAAQIVAVRDGRRWRPVLVPLDDAPPAPRPGAQPATGLVEGGLYLVTGGLGGIARQLAGYLAVEHGMRLLLVGRSPATGEAAAELAALADVADVVHRQVDVADGVALEAAVAEAEARWGRPLDGVLHLAGANPWTAGEPPVPVARRSPDAFAEQYRAKVAGTLAIAAVLQARPAASLTLFGSVNGEFGGHAFGPYAAASSFLVGFADHWHHEHGRPVQCLAWSVWTDVGMSRGQAVTAAEHRGFRAVEPARGLRLFLAAAALPDHYVLLGLDLTNRWIVDEVAVDRVEVSEVVVAYAAPDVEPEALDAAVAAAARSCPAPVRLVRVPRIPRGHAGEVDGARLLLDCAADRPVRAFAEPVGDLEQRLARCWAATLDRPRIGRDESFFELGGNSLTAVRLLALVDRELGVAVTSQALYEDATVAGMAVAVARARGRVPV